MMPICMFQYGVSSTKHKWMLNFRIVAEQLDAQHEPSFEVVLAEYYQVTQLPASLKIDGRGVSTGNDRLFCVLS